MRIQSINLSNFGSYKSLSFEYGKGLTLIQGATGSGKSTFSDAIPWVLFGKTAKGGAADEVKTWNANEDTSGRIVFRLNGDQGYIHRSRGKSGDLFISMGRQAPIRGKDRIDTQRIINQILGFDYDMYMAGAYYHEFSETAQFFTATAKQRRDITEKLADLSLPIKLKQGLSEWIKLHSITLHELEMESIRIRSNISLLEGLQIKENQKSALWEKIHRDTKEAVLSNYTRFEANRTSVVTNECRYCNTVLAEPKHIHNDTPNPYTERLKELETERNPHVDATKDYTKDIEEKRHEVDYLHNEMDGVRVHIGDAEALLRVTEMYRATAITNTVSLLENKTNELLATFFDAEIRVKFDVTAADKLDITLHKDGNTCTYTQLSKGQRCLLKLCFGVSVMDAIQNQHSLHFSQAFFDEALDGLDDNFKTKAYRLFESKLQGMDAIYLVEHNEALKTLFENKYSVELVNGESIIAKTI